MAQSLRMLIVEDCEDDAILLVRELERGGYALTWERVQTTEAMRTALRKQAWDVIIADYSMPEFDAPSALALLQQTGFDLPFIVVSGTIGEDVAVAMMRNGAHDYIMKDNLTRLVPAVERELREAHERRKRREAEASLRQSERSLAEAQRVAHLGNWDWDIQANELRWSDEIYRIFGLEPQEFDATYEAFLQAVHSDDRESVQKAVDDAQHARTPYRLDHRIVLPSGEERIVHEQAEVRFDADGIPIRMLGTVHDVTERKRAEEAMVRVSRLDSLALLAGGIAHDFNNILTGIMGNVSLSRLHAGPDGAVAQRLEEAEKACRRATNLTHQLLTFAKGGAPIRTTASLAELIEDSVSFALRGSGVRCQLQIAEDLWPAEIDEGQISQVINNLVINADEAMCNGGVVVVEAENVPAGDCEFPALGTGRYVKLSIQDQGIGIAPDHLERVFDPYFTTKQKGSGLGLATTHSIIKQHDGAIAVDSKLGSGTTFHLYLPASDKPVPISPQVDQELASGTGRILVMDDEEMVRDVGARMLTLLGYNVEFAEDGAEAIALYEHALDSGEPFDAVVMDLTIPGGMGGKEAIQKLREIDPDVRAIASSGYSTDPVMANYEEHGFAAVVPKPYQTQELGRAVHEVLANHRNAPAAD